MRTPLSLRLALIGVFFLLAVLGCTKKIQPQLLNQNTSTQPSSVNQNIEPSPIFGKANLFALQPKRESGIRGKAIVQDVNDKARVTLSMTGVQSGVTMPSSIRLGSCSALGDILYILNPVFGGASETLLDVSIEAMIKKLPLSIVVHKSTKEPDVAVSCAPITSESTPASSQTPPTSLGTTKEFRLSASNYSFDQRELRVKQGDIVDLYVKSLQGEHDLVIDGYSIRTKRLKQGEADNISFTAHTKGSFEYYCSVGTHKQLGMRGILVVE